jgi:putative lipoprotein
MRSLRCESLRILRPRALTKQAPRHGARARAGAIGLFASLLPLACAGHGSLAASEARAPASPAPTDAPATTLAFDCDGLGFAVQIRDQTALLSLPERSLELSRVPAASGAKYASGAVVFWSKGDEALLDLEAASYRGCKRNPSRSIWEDARLRGVTFRGVGNEPGWSVEVEAGERIVLVTDYGGTRVELPLPAPQIAPGDARTSWRARSETHELVLRIEPGACHDSMSGESFESRVTAILDAREHRGCGRWLRAAAPARRGGFSPRPPRRA